MESKGSFEYSAKVIDELRSRTDEHVRLIEEGLGEQAHEGAAALRKMLDRLVLK